MVGLAIGLFAGFLFYLSKRPAPAPTAISLPAPPAHTAKPAPKTSAPAAQKPAQDAATAPPKFDFYTLLPKLEVVVPGGKSQTAKPIQNAKPAPSAPPQKVETPGSYMLQTGSFRTYTQANRMKASLALLGFVSTISQVQVGSNTWNRVQIGPFKDLKKLNAARDDLQKHHVDTLVIKVNG